MGIITYSSDRGMRTYQEDRCFTGVKKVGEKTITLLAVMDGHGGSDTAEYCRSRMQDLFDLLFNNPSVERVRGALLQTIAVLEEETRNMVAGTTISIIAIIDGKKAVSAVLGDSPIVIFDKGDVVVGPNHNVRTNKEEAAAVIGRGGFVRDGYLFVQQGGPVLQIARALGDREFGDVLDREPEMSVADLGGGSIVLVATDGLFSQPRAGGNFFEFLDDVMEFIDKGYDADELVERAKLRGSTDNITVILWRSENDK